MAGMIPDFRFAGWVAMGYSRSMTRVYEEIVDFITARIAPQDMANWTPSDEARAELWRLVQAEKDGALSDAQRVDLNHYLELEHLMRLAKAKANQRATNE
jgi:hypothetical protein